MDPGSADQFGPPVSTRAASIDIFRGLTMVVMIFVNDLASVKGLPWWNYHMPGNVDGMTYVDMVFPAFLFVLGMSIPIAVRQRLNRDGSIARLCGHVVVRAISLVVLGLVLANAPKGDPVLMGINPNAWAAITLLGAVGFLMVYRQQERHRTLFRILKIAGLVLMVGMLAIFRRTTHSGHVAWLDFSYWEILGLIGWTYLGISILYIPARKRRWAPLMWCGLLLILNVVSVAQWIRWPQQTPLYIWPFGSGALSLIAMAGVATSEMFLGKREPRTPSALGFAGAALAAGWLLTPLGISKIRATPAWCLYCVGSSVLLFAALYWICDVKKRTRWASFANAAGTNTLLTYLLPDFYYFVTWALGLGYIEGRFAEGWPGVIRAVVFTAAMLAIAAVLTKRKIRVQL